MNLTTDDGVRLNYQQTGGGPSLIFLHGFWGLPAGLGSPGGLLFQPGLPSHHL